MYSISLVHRPSVHVYGTGLTEGLDECITLVSFTDSQYGTGLTEGLGECIPLVSFTDSQYSTGSH